MGERTKKVKLFVVEGPSDETALGLILDRLYSNDRVMFDVVHGDISTDLRGKKPRDVARDQVVEHVSRQAYEWRDLGEIVHIVDTDGAFVDDVAVLQTEDGGALEYREDVICAPNPDVIRRRNAIKSTSLNQLSSIGQLAYNRMGVPYGVYYMSRNLEHALSGEAGNVSDQEKKRLARRFQQRYKGDLQGFLDFMNDEIGVAGDYRETWDHIMEGENSLKRGSNLCVMLPQKVGSAT